MIETDEDCSQIIQKGIEALILHEYVDAVQVSEFAESLTFL